MSGKGFVFPPQNEELGPKGILGPTPDRSESGIQSVRMAAAKPGKTVSGVTTVSGVSFLSETSLPDATKPPEEEQEGSKPSKDSSKDAKEDSSGQQDHAATSGQKEPPRPAASKESLGESHWSSAVHRSSVQDAIIKRTRSLTGADGAKNWKLKVKGVLRMLYFFCNYPQNWRARLEEDDERIAEEEVYFAGIWTDVFLAIDTDGSGSLDREEMQTWFESPLTTSRRSSYPPHTIFFSSTQQQHISADTNLLPYLLSSHVFLCHDCIFIFIVPQCEKICTTT